MQAQFEIEKNRKAFTYTAIICGILLLLALFIRWTIALPPAPVVQDLIEINLGNNAEGYGKVQPLIKGEMSQAAQTPEPQPAKATPAHEEATKDIQPDENEDKDAAPVTKPVKTNPKATKIADEPVKKPIKNTAAPVTMPTPKPKKPEATYQGPGHEKGNGATEDNGYKYQGNNPNGHSDAGDPSGKPDSYGNSPGGKIGISSGLKGRRITGPLPSFTDDFNENAKVYVDITVDVSGHVITTSIARGTSTTNPTIRGIALQKAKLLKFNSGEEDQGTIVFVFKVHN